MSKETWKLSQKVGKLLNITPQRDGFHPDFSADMNTAWLLVEAMRERGFKFQMHSKIIAGWEATFYRDGYYKEIHGITSLVPPTAILKAAAMALGVYDD